LFAFQRAQPFANRILGTRDTLMMRWLRLAPIPLASSCFCTAVVAQDKQKLSPPVDVAIQGHVYRPAQLEPTDARIAKLHAPDGFRINKFAEGMINPRMLAVSDDGTIYVTRRDIGDCVMLRDTNGDGVADARKVVAERPDMHGIAIDGRRMYLTAVKEVYTADIQSDGTLANFTRIISDLPDAGQHPNRTLAIGPDKQLYVSVGSTCNTCDEANPENATMLQVTPDGYYRTIFASGLRNTIGFGWHPATHELWGMDNGVDWFGDDDQKEELNHIERGKRYGWPFVYADGKLSPDREPKGGITNAQWRQQSTEPVLLYTAHSAPLQMAFYTGSQFPEEYRNDAFVAMRGSWNRKTPSGYEVVRIRFDKAGKPQGIEPFVTGFVQQEGTGYGYIARLAGCAVAKDGSLLVSDDKNGVIYRISYAAAKGGAR